MQKHKVADDILVISFAISAIISLFLVMYTLSKDTDHAIWTLVSIIITVILFIGTRLNVRHLTSVLDYSHKDQAFLYDE